MTSEKFAQYMDKAFMKDSELVFIIGGPLGIE